MVLAACSKQAATVSVPYVEPFQTDVLLVQVDDPANVPDWSGMPGVVSARRLFVDEPRFEGAMHDFGLDRWYKLSVDPSVPVTKSFGGVEGISLVERRMKPSAAVLPDDPDLKLQTSLISSTSSPDIHLLPLWENGFTGSSDIAVAIVDGGIDSAHPDLAANCGPAEDFTGKGIQTHAHGTHVAGIVSAVRGNGIGISGIAGGSGKGDGTKLLSAQIFYNEDGSDILGDYEAAIVWAANHGAVIAQNSWAFKADTNGDGELSETEKSAYRSSHITIAFKYALEYFTTMAGCDPQTREQLPGSPMKGGLLVFAAGNEGLDTNPVAAEFPDAIFVGATDSEGKPAKFSNHGDWVDIWAPGTGIYSTLPDGTYGRLNGTSMACPHVAGAAALILQACGGPGFTPSQLAERLKGGASGDASAPFLDAMGALRYGAEDNKPPILQAELSEAEIHAHERFVTKFTVSDPDDDAVTISVDNEVFTVSKKGPDTYEVALDGKTSGAGTFTATVTATDRLGATDVRPLSVTVLPNQAPVLTGRIVPVLLRKTGDRFSMNLRDYFSDPDGETLSFSASSSNPDVVFVSRTSDNLSLIMLAEGRAEVSIRATDALGTYENVSFPVFASPDGITLVTVPEQKVESWLTIIAGSDPVPAHVTLQTATGAVLYDGNVSLGVSSPLMLDLSLIAPVRLLLSVSYGGQTYTKTLVKL